GAQVALLVEEAAPSARGATFGGLALDPGFGQANPQTTAGDGGFAFAPPAGVYRLWVTADGYQPYRSAAVEVEDGSVNPTIALTPVVNDPPDATIVMGEGGFDPDRLTVPPGTVIEWVNGDLAEHRVAAETWDSGVLWPGERFRLRLDDAGEFVYGDGENPLHDGVVIVDPSAPPVGTRFIYLPVVAR
ncbi:MAG: hypothetical protein D6790_20280, partial [Caldilineae bacterium]